MGLAYLLLEVYICILLILAFIPIFQQAGAELDLIKLIVEFILRLFS